MPRRRFNAIAPPVSVVPGIPGIDLYNLGVLLAGGPYTALNSVNAQLVFANSGGGLASLTVVAGTGTVGPGTVNTVAMFTPNTTTVRDSHIVEDQLGVTYGIRDRASQSAGVGDDAAFAGSYGSVYFTVASATGAAWSDPLTGMNRGVNVVVTQDVTAMTTFGTFQSFLSEFAGTGNAGHAFTAIRGYVASNFLTGAGALATEITDFKAESGWSNAAGLVNRIIGFYATQFGGTTPATEAIAFYADQRSMNAVTTWSFYAEDAPAWFGGGVTIRSNGGSALVSGNTYGSGPVPVTLMPQRVAIGPVDLTDQFNVDSSLNVEHMDPTGVYSNFYTYLNIGADAALSITNTGKAYAVTAYPSFDITSLGVFEWGGVDLSQTIGGTGTVGTIADITVRPFFGSLTGTVSVYSGVHVVPGNSAAGPVATAYGFRVNFNQVFGTDAYAFHVSAGSFANISGLKWGLFLADSDAFFGADIKVTGDTIGAGTVLGFGTNSPASTLTGPYTWVKLISSDGSTVWLPAYK